MSTPKIVPIIIHSSLKNSRKSIKSSPSPIKSSDQRTSSLYKQPLSQLSKKIGSKKEIYKQLYKQNEKKRRNNQLLKQYQSAIKRQLAESKEELPQQILTSKQLWLCKKLFNILDQQHKNYTIKEDLDNINDQSLSQIIQIKDHNLTSQLKKILKAIYYRKENNAFYDFVYALWDSGRINSIINLLSI